MKYSCDSIKIEFEQWPSLIPERLRTTGFKGPLKALRGASARRYFKFERDWQIKIELINDKYDPAIAGTVLIPKYYQEDSNPKTETRIDGASVPLPWLISFLSFGALRPLGVMLIGSIVHDFAFEYGQLLYLQPSGEIERRDIQRHVADELFYDIIKTVNNMPVTALLAWLAVRLGWFWVKYDGKRRGGKVPYFAIGFLILVFLFLGGMIFFFGIEHVISGFVGLYLFIFILLQLTAPEPEDNSTAS